MSLIRHAPWAVRTALPNDIKHVLEKFIADAEGGSVSTAANPWVPRVDIKEEPTRFVIVADIPGIDPKDIEIQMDKGVLSIRGERAALSSVENERYSRVERTHGAFQRRFTLPDSADAEGISATGRHGVLEISIPKKAEAAPRRIEVQ
jgi:HSP20 family protein